MCIIPSVIYVDDSLLVINKPAGLLCLPDGHDPSIPHIRALLEPKYGRLWMVHRLDKETSGVMALARTETSHRCLNNLFSKHIVEKVYHAILVGNPPWNAKRVDKALRANVGRRKRTIIDPCNGKPATTEFQILERFENYALVEARPKTGRTHQIRVHLYKLGYPILADPLYGQGESSVIINRLALHAHSISLQHPLSGEALWFEAPGEQDFMSGLCALRQKSNL